MRRRAGRKVNTNEVDLMCLTNIFTPDKPSNKFLYPVYLYTNKAQKATNKTIKHPNRCPNGRTNCFCGNVKKSGIYRRHQLKKDLQQEIKFNF